MIVLLAAAGLANPEIALRVGVCVDTVRKVAPPLGGGAR